MYFPSAHADEETGNEMKDERWHKYVKPCEFYGEDWAVLDMENAENGRKTTNVASVQLTYKDGHKETFTQQNMLDRLKTERKELMERLDRKERERNERR